MAVATKKNNNSSYRHLEKRTSSAHVFSRRTAGMFWTTLYCVILNMQNGRIDVAPTRRRLLN
jgi:hypothetical protein